MPRSTAARAALPPVSAWSSLAAEHDPDRVAFGEGPDGPEVTWAAFDERSTRAATAFRRHLSQGDRVAFLCAGSIDHVTLWNGALQAGAVVSNLHTRAAPETVRYCLDVLEPRVLVVDEGLSAFVREELDEWVAGLDAVVVIGEAGDDAVAMDAFLDAPAAPAPDVRSRAGDVAVVMWTSGTTGRPTGWCHTNHTLGLKALHLQGHQRLERTARQPHVFTPSFAAWYSLVLPALLSGASTYFLAGWDPGAYLATIEARELTNAILVPTMWRELLAHERRDDHDLGSLRSIGASGERLDPSTLADLREHVCADVSNAYAATEVLATWITNEELEGERIESVGKPIGGTRVRVVSEDGSPDEPLPPGEVGEVVVKGADRAVWAWGDTATTEAAFEDGWWRSGDLGYTDDAGYLYLAGRQDHMILSKGMKVFPGPVEERLNAHPGVEEVAVVGVEDEEYGERVTAVVSRSDPDLTADDLDAWCLESDDLARYERPRAYRFVDGPLSRTATGKLDRAALRGRVE